MVDLVKQTESQLISLEPYLTMLKFLTPTKLIASFSSNKFLIFDLTKGTLDEASRKMEFPENYLSRYN